jgi:hypothetical protein
MALNFPAATLAVGRLEELMDFSQFFSEISTKIAPNPKKDLMVYHPNQVVASDPFSDNRLSVKTRSGEFRKKAVFRQFTLPAPIDQIDVQNNLAVMKELILPPLTSEDKASLRWLLDQVDLVLLNGLQDSENWVVPNEFTELTIVQNSLNNQIPLERVICTILQGIRTYVWMYREHLFPFIPLILDLEEALYCISSELNPPESASTQQFSESDSESG